MKKTILIALMGVLFSTTYAQADPAFTAKMIDHVSAVKAWGTAGRPASGFEYDAVRTSVASFYPAYKNSFASKMQDMFNSPAEMSKFSDPISFVQCLGAGAIQYQSCLGAGNTPNTVHPATLIACNESHMAFIVGCIIVHLID